MRQFFVEFRLYGHPKHYLKGLTYEVARRFRVKGAIKPRPVPHMTLYGPSETKEIRRVFTTIENVAKKYTLVPIRIEGFECRDGIEGKVIACHIKASAELVSLRRELAEELAKISKPNHWDTQRGYWFHTTIAFKDIDHKFNDILRYLTTNRQPRFDQYLLRITILGKGRKIIREYDLVLKKWLSRTQVLFNKWYWRRKTESRLRELQGLSSRRRCSTWRAIIDFVRNLRIRKQIYLIADTHFDHGNIIKYCDRLFNNAQEMNKFMVNNWNNTVGPKDTVYHLGDWSFGRGSRSPNYWRKKLHGHILSVKGGHDRKTRGMRFSGYRVLRYGGYSFLLVHDPDKKPFDWHGWVIHGHKHNNHMRNYPFINGERKTINVSVELVGYKPVSIDSLISLDINSIRRMRTIDSQPERW